MNSASNKIPGKTTKRIYDEAIRQALTLVREAGDRDRMCGKRLKVALPSLVTSLEVTDIYLVLDAEVRGRLLAVSPATIDRILDPVRERAESADDENDKIRFRVGSPCERTKMRTSLCRATSSATSWSIAAVSQLVAACTCTYTR